MLSTQHLIQYKNVLVPVLILARYLHIHSKNDQYEYYEYYAGLVHVVFLNTFVPVNVKILPLTFPESFDKVLFAAA